MKIGCSRYLNHIVRVSNFSLIKLIRLRCISLKYISTNTKEIENIIVACSNVAQVVIPVCFSKRAHELEILVCFMLYKHAVQNKQNLSLDINSIKDTLELISLLIKTALMLLIFSHKVKREKTFVRSGNRSISICDAPH